MYAAFDSDACFRISDTVQFGIAVATCVPGFQSGCEGPCSYQDVRSIKREIGQLQFNPRAPTFEALAATLQQLGQLDGYFLKDWKYRHQAEYRFIWNVAEPVTDSVFVTCREALKYCVRVDRNGKEVPLS